MTPRIEALLSASGGGLGEGSRRLAESPEEAAMLRERLDRLRAAVGALSPSDRDLVRHRWVEEETLGEIGLGGVGPNRRRVGSERARQLTARVLRKLRKILRALETGSLARRTR